MLFRKVLLLVRSEVMSVGSRCRWLVVEGVVSQLC